MESCSSAALWKNIRYPKNWRGYNNLRQHRDNNGMETLIVQMKIANRIKPYSQRMKVVCRLCTN
jgi:hypothetical protein